MRRLPSQSNHLFRNCEASYTVRLCWLFRFNIVRLFSNRTGTVTGIAAETRSDNLAATWV